MEKKYTPCGGCGATNPIDRCIGCFHPFEQEEENKYPIGGYAPGNYHCKCCACGNQFTGDKRAVQCEPCAVADKERFDALSPAEQEELVKRNVEMANGIFKGSVKFDSHWTIGRSEARFKELENKGWDWRSFYNGWIEGRADAVMDILKREQGARQGAVWVKASERLPVNSNLVHINYGTGKTDFKLTGYYEPSEKKWHRQDGGFLDWAPNLEWLDENAGEKDVDPLGFAEWATGIAFFDEDYRLWNFLEEGKMIDGRFRFSTEEFYEVYKKEVKP